MKTNRIASLVALASLLLWPMSDGGAQDIKDADEIVKRVNLAQYYAGDDGRALIRMKIVDAQGRSRRRQFTVIRRDQTDGGDQNYLVVFDKPADVRNTAFLVNKHVKRDDDRWLYLPGLDLVKRIAASDERTSFVGTHFFYEDISGRHPTEDAHQLLETTDGHYLIKSTPKKPGAVEFAHYKLWVDKTTFLPKKIEYFDNKGKLYRKIETAEVQTLEGLPTITRMKVTDVEGGGYTLSDISQVSYNLGIPNDVFGEKSLRNPPAKWLH